MIPDRLSADSGYCSETNLEALEAHGIDGYVAPGRANVAYVAIRFYVTADHHSCIEPVSEASR